MEPTAELLGNTLVATILYAVFGVAVTIYSLWLNWKQSKVKDIQEEQTQILREIRDKLR